MADKITKAQRSYTMSKIRSANTKPEMIVRKYLFAKGIRFRVNYKRLPGKPDIVLRKYSTVIFVNGCFWHGHNCEDYKPPKTHKKYWLEKINSNKQRDKKTCAQLKAMGWNIMIIWTCQLKPKNREQTLEEIVYLLSKVFLEKYKIKNTKPYKISEPEYDVAAESGAKYKRSERLND